MSRKLKRAGGIVLRERKRVIRDEPYIEYYLQVTHPTHGKAPKQIYVGNSNTFTPSRLRDAMRLARQIRANLINEHLSTQKGE